MNDFPNTGRAGLPQPAAKAGSALLIVLGFLSFMVVSAVAFSIYMRSERMPSSALRRTVATRQLVRAALSEAMSRVDDAVRGDPFPGLRDPSTSYQPRGDVENFWEGRVFMPPNPEYDGDRRRYAPATETVSTLTLEGLGYVPAPLMNDARFLGRATWTAAWNGFPYDAGRYAFVALNVSDYFDVNCAYANRPRTSNPNGRISLAYLFAPNFRSSSGGAGAGVRVDDFDTSNVAAFDKLTHDNREGGNDSGSVGKDAPYVSMLDFGLALGNQTIGLMPSFFYNWIHDGGANKILYPEGSEQFELACRQPFVADSWATNETYDIDISYYQGPSGKKGQPFDNEVKQDNVSLVQLNSKAASSQFFMPLTKGSSPLKFANGLESLSIFSAALFDYLDHNDIPASLAWPCIERVPMFATAEPVVGFKLPLVQPATQDGTTTWSFDPNSWLQNGMLAAAYAFPFKRNAADRNDTFKAQAIVRIFLAPEGVNLRAAQGLGEALRPKSQGDWTRKENMFELSGQKNVFCLTFVPDAQQLNISSNIRNDDDAGDNVTFPLNMGAMGTLSPTPLVTRTEEQDPKTKQKVNRYVVNVSPLGLDGKPMFAVGETLEEADFRSKAQTPLRPYLCVWLRIVNGDNKTVDLVPAVMEDDQTLNSGASTVQALSQYLLQSSDGPLLRFTGGQTFSFANMVDGQGADSAVEWSPKSFSTLDPRFNWAPEDWYSAGEGDSKFERWLDRTNKYLESNEAEALGCDSDIFCAVSNQGFLQSLGEFAFLPRLTDIDGSGVPLLAIRGAAGGFDGVQRNSAGEIASRRCAWCSYSMDREVYEALKSCGIGRSSPGECLVNPYTPSRDVFMAALANTPCDYWAAGVGLNADVKIKAQLGDSQLPSVGDAKTAAEKYAFSMSNQEAYMTGQELERIADALRSRLRDPQELKNARDEMRKTSPKAQMADAWEVIWDNLNWMPNRNNPDFKSFLGVQLSRELYGIDRKFLYSYWRDCLGNRQQLFLIFLRAESNAIGGIGEGTPGQKGGRAVALVWRNPAATTDASSGPDGVADDGNATWNEKRRPHQMRVLFYHQFD